MFLIRNLASAGSILLISFNHDLVREVTYRSLVSNRTSNARNHVTL